VVSFTPRPLYPQGKIPYYLLDRRLGGPESRFGRGGEEKNSQVINIIRNFKHCSLDLNSHPKKAFVYLYTIGFFCLSLNFVGTT
jgi:hypothetical protein